MPCVTVKGMRCEHCEQAVLQALSNIRGLSGARVDLKTGQVSWTDADPGSPAAVDDVKKAVRAIGFEA